MRRLTHYVIPPISYPNYLQDDLDPTPRACVGVGLPRSGRLLPAASLHCVASSFQNPQHREVQMFGLKFYLFVLLF